MKPSRSIFIWLALTICAVLVIGAMAWLTRHVLESKREQAIAESRAVLEEQTRLALWRMDAVGAAIVLRENQRQPMAQADTAIPDAPEIRGRFTLADGDRRIEASGTTLPPLSADACVAALGIGEGTWQAVPKDNEFLKSRNLRSNGAPLPQSRLRQESQTDYNRIELAQRAKSLDDQTFLSNSANNGNWSSLLIRDLGVMRPVWVDNELYLLRRIELLGSPPSGMIQGVWLDAEKARAMLLAEVADLIDGAELKPRLNGTTHPLSLVSLPFDLVRDDTIIPPAVGWNIALSIGWFAVIAALMMAGLLVHGVMRLSERRASFVSAVTHELRTPLTTFRLYSDMLQAGAVKEEKREGYLRALSREADRLSHLVENVLAFSRIERGNARSNVREISTAELLDQSRERLEARLATAGLALEMDLSCTQIVLADTAAVEHILFNLIDNAAKYAAGGKPPLVIISAEKDGTFVAITVRDHGPGIPVAERQRVFRAFHKSAHEAAESQPGVGLGLALSRRLARQQGGDLRITDTGFILRLPAVIPSKAGGQAH